MERLRQLGITDQYLKQSLSAIIYQRLIPALNHQFGALLTIKTAHQLWPKSSDDHSLDEWRRKLNVLVKNQTISQATSAKYWFG